MTLQEQAENIITRLNLVEKLTPFGEVHVVGNVAFQTTTKPDIDIQIYCERHYEEAGVEIVALLKEMGLEGVKERRLKRSKKYLVLANTKVDDVIWPIDITLTQPNKYYLKDSYQFFLDYDSKMTDEKRKLIIEFKEHFADEKIAGDNSAYYIYLAVLDEGITNDLDMRKYLTKMKSK